MIAVQCSRNNIMLNIEIMKSYAVGQVGEFVVRRAVVCGQINYNPRAQGGMA